VQVTDLNIWILKSRLILYEAVLFSLAVRSSPWHLEGPDLIPIREFYFRAQYNRRSKGKIPKSIAEVRICSGGTFLNKLFTVKKIAIEDFQLLRNISLKDCGYEDTNYWKHSIENMQLGKSLLQIAE
jgi:hypothetical protein